MKRRDVLKSRCELPPERLPFGLVRLELTLQGGLRGCLSLCHVLVKVSDEDVNHVDHTGILSGFCLVWADRLRWRGRGHLCSRNARARDASCGCCWDGTALSHKYP